MMMTMVVRLVLVMAAMLTCAVCGEARMYKVGGAFGWTDQSDSRGNKVNYTLWSNNQTFYTGDWLQFVFDKTRYNVLQVNETSYGNCMDKDFISNITKGGRDVTQLTKPQSYYYISSGGYCFGGMKLAVDVHDAPPPSPSPNLSKNSSPSAAGSGDSWILLTFALVIYATISIGCASPPHVPIIITGS